MEASSGHLRYYVYVCENHTQFFRQQFQCYNVTTGDIVIIMQFLDVYILTHMHM